MILYLTIGMGLYTLISIWYTVANMGYKFGTPLSKVKYIGNILELIITLPVLAITSLMVIPGLNIIIGIIIVPLALGFAYLWEWVKENCEKS